MDRETAKDLRSEMQIALNNVANKHGMVVKLGNGTFTSNQFWLKVTFQDDDEGSGSFEETNFKQYASMFGLKPSDFGRTFTYNGKRYKVVGIKPQARRFPIVAERQPDGRRFKFPSTVIKD